MTSKKNTIGSQLDNIVIGAILPRLLAVVIFKRFKRLYHKDKHLKDCIFYTDN